MDNGYSLADIATASGNTGWAGNEFIWIFALLILFGNGGFGRGDYGQFATSAGQQEILFGQQFQNLDNKIDRLGNGIADATFALNNSIKDGNYATQTAIKDCCCTTQRAIDSVNYNGAINTATINANTTAQTQKILDAIAQNKIEALQGRVNQLELQSALCGVVRYPNAMTYDAGPSPFCSCNNRCCAM